MGQSNPSFVPSVMKRTNWIVITTRQSEQILYWCRIRGHSWSRTVLHDERHCRIPTIHRYQWLVVNSFFLEMKNRLIWKVGFKGTPKLGPFWKSQPVTYKVNVMGQNFSLNRLVREEDGAIEFWRKKDYLRNDFVHSQHWSDEKWKSKMVGGGGNKKRFEYCTDASGQIL